MITITNTAVGPLTHILEHLRPADKQEIEAARGEKFDRFLMAIELHKLSQNCDGWIFWNPLTSEPIAAIGAYAMTPKVVGCWAFSTSDWPVVAAKVTRHAHRIMLPRLLEAGFHRAECRALSKRSDTERWLTGMGWRAEAVLSGFGIRREDFTLFAWRPDEQTHPSYRPQRQSEVPLRRH